MIAKAGLGLIGLGAISIGGVAVTKPHWLGMDHMPDWKALNKDSNFSETSVYADNTFGKKRGRYLVSATNADNKNWWEWSFRRLEQKEKRSEKFKNVERGYDGENSLKKVCDEAYKKQEDNNNFYDTGTDTTKFKKSDVWKYCSPLGKEPSTLNQIENKTEDNRQAKYTDDTKFGKSKEGKLVSVDDPANNKFWEIRDKEFKEEGANSLTNGDEDSYFVKNKAGKTIKELCEYVYGQSSNTNADTGKIEETKVLKYCSYDSTAS